MTTKVFIADELFKHLYEKCLKEQLEMFSYHPEDHFHIYLNKYYIVVDTLLRMLAEYRTFVKSEDKSVIVYFKELPKLSSLPLTTIDFKPTTVSAQMNELAYALNYVRIKFGNNDKEFYKVIEEFLVQRPVPLTYHSICSLNTTVGSSRIFKINSMFVDSLISKALAPFQMRLSKAELEIVVNLFLVYSGARIYKSDTILSDDELRIALNIDSIQFIHTQIPNRLIIHPKIEYSTFLTPTLSVCPYERYMILQKYHIRETKDVTYVYPSNPTLRPILKKQKIKAIPLKPILEYLDSYYKNTLMYINTYISMCLEDADKLYKSKSFRTPKYETFEDTDLALCTYDTFHDSLNRLITNFNKLFYYNVILI